MVSLFNNFRNKTTFYLFDEEDSVAGCHVRLGVEGALVVVSVDSGEFDLVAGLAYVAEVAEEDGVF